MPAPWRDEELVRVPHKKRLLIKEVFGADGGTRTHMSSLTTDFESVASANSTTSAKVLAISFYIC